LVHSRFRARSADSTQRFWQFAEKRHSQAGWYIAAAEEAAEELAFPATAPEQAAEKFGVQEKA
jgi:hypothetical protein